MSLASLLLAGAAQVALKKPTKVARPKSHVDEDLDALFRSHPAPPVAIPHSTGKPIAIPSQLALNSLTRGHKRKRHQDGIPPDPSTAAVASGTSKVVKHQRSLLVTREPVPSSSCMDEEDTGLEDRYFNRRTADTVATGVDGGSVDESLGEEDGATEPPMHEIHAGTPASKVGWKSRKKAKHVPPDETPAQRDARTIFVGNVSVDVAKNKSSQKQFKRYLLSHVAGSKIESLRFRSVAFATVTAALPASEDATSAPTQVDSKNHQRQQERTSKWREIHYDHMAPRKTLSRRDDDATSDREEGSGKCKKPSYRNPAEKKRVAFIRREFHQEADSVNVYVVFAHSPPRSAAEESSHTVHPFDAAGVAVERCDGTTFLERTIRVDRVGQWRTGCGMEDVTSVGGMGDPRQTLFVGNLDFAAKEEELRVWFEGVVSQGLGPHVDDAGGDGEAEREADGLGRPNGWVKHVRIIRDRDTQLGKGFAYVRFADRDCVDEVLGLEPDKLKFAKRELRVQRCKVIPSGDAGAPWKQKSTFLLGQPKIGHAKKTTIPTLVPRGDPSLGGRLAGLSKDDRKAAKASNIDRVKRRVAKKRFKAEADKAKDRNSEKRRERERKMSGKWEKGHAVKKGRIRSERSVAKRNAKK